MHISSCLHPVRIYNIYTHEQMFVPCGKCAACANSRAKKWIDRLNQESRCWKYCFNLYLDYSDAFVPTFQIVGEYLLEQQKRFFRRFTFDDVCIPLQDLNIKDYELDYLVNRCECHHGIPHASVLDVQQFKKRLNKYIFKHITGTYNNFRSAIVAEYGPTTFRGHYHGLLWFNDDRIAARIQEAVSKCWKFGHSTADAPKHSRNAIAGYVAQYLNRPTHLPTFYTHRLLSPFFLTSRYPPIGSLYESDSEIQRLFLSGSVCRVTENVRDGKTEICSVPLSSTLKARLYPKCPRFSTLSDPCRIELYRCLLQENGEPYDTWEECYFYLRKKLGIRDDYFGLDIYKSNWSNYWLFRFFSDITEKFTNVASLLSLYRNTKRIYLQSMIFGISYSEYIKRILKFYKDYELFKLKQFYEFQEEYTRTHLVSGLLYAYPLDCHLRNCFPHWLQEHLDLSKCDEFVQYKAHSEYLFEESHKRVKQNGYLEKLKLRDPVLLKIINDYHYGKKCYETNEAVSCSRSERLRFVPPRSKHNQLRRDFAVLKNPHCAWW